MAVAPDVLVLGEPFVLLVEPAAAPAVVVAAGTQGPPGRDGVGAGGITYIQDHRPVGASESETWWNPLTLQLKVFHNNDFEPVSPDGGHF
ncbi:MAG: hypothetical protein ACN6P1_05600 [Pseudomonas sp.]|uniref:hypothetical protein n=1 Tax=Pseudomonas sp. TaxID=306 RepID=UPI003D150135